MTVRLLTEKDAQAYRDLRLEALQKNPEAFAAIFEDEQKKPLEYYQKRLKRNEFWTYGYFVQNELVGIVTLLREQGPKLHHRSSIVAMYVTEKVRKRGIGKELMQAAIEQAKKIDGIEQIYLSVVTTNISAIALYQALGFEIYGTEKRALKTVDGTYWNEYHMVLFL